MLENFDGTISGAPEFPTSQVCMYISNWYLISKFDKETLNTEHGALSSICAREDTLQETDSPPGVRPDVLLHSPPAHLHTQTSNIGNLLSSKLYKEGRDFGLIWSNCVELYVRLNNYFHLLLVKNFLVEKRRRKESRQGIHLYKNHYLKRELYYCSYCSLEAFCEAHPGPTGRTTDVIKYEFSEVS